MSNVLVEQYGIHKLKALKSSPYACLIDSDIQHTPHQIDAYVSAIHALKNSGGIILADEVGLGKTIEAGLVLKHLIANGAKKILIAMPPPLRKQWQMELKEKFDIEAVIPDGKYAIQHRDRDDWNYKLYKQTEPLVVITSFGMAPWFITRAKNVVWDCFVFDEAHRLRNYPNAKMPKALFDATRHIPKIMLTATPMQNYLRDLYALTHFIDERIFVSEAVFNERYVASEDYAGLREAIAPVLHRTLRKDVAEYINFPPRDCMAVDFKLTLDEAILYQLASEYLRRPQLFAVNTSNAVLVRMVIRKLLASSSFAVIETFEVLKQRLLVLKEDTKVEKAEISLKEFFSLIDDDSDEAEDDFEDNFEDIDRKKYRDQIDDELHAIENIIMAAEKITANSKAKALIEALGLAFEVQRDNGFPEKALIFTESKRTQRYLKETLLAAGFDDIVCFNGEMNDPEIKQIYLAWRGKFPAHLTNAPSVDLKQAIVDHFKNEAKILIATDVASEGLNLQFCDTVINYDLPWNPMKIEQRIGRCHRFGQERSVWVYNLLNRENAADARVYEILEKKFNLFKGVFGASDDALGLLESGSNFEKRIMEIYIRCTTQAEIKREFDKLEREITAKRNKKYHELKTLLNQVDSKKKSEQFHKIVRQLENYIKDRETWDDFAKNPPTLIHNQVFELPDGTISFDNGENGVLEHGYIFAGCLCKTPEMTFIEPLLCVYDEDGKPYPLSNREILDTIKDIPNEDFISYSPIKKEFDLFHEIFDCIADRYKSYYRNRHEPDITIHRKKLANWVENKRGVYLESVQELKNRLRIVTAEKEASKLFQEKIDKLNEIEKLNEQIRQADVNFHKEMTEIEAQADADLAEYISGFEIEPLALPNAIVKF